MGEPRAQQFGDDITHAARRVEMVHIAIAVGVDPGDQRHGGGQFVHILPVDLDAGGARHGGDVDGMVRGAAGGQQPYGGVHDGAFVDHMAHGARIGALGADGGEAMDSLAGERAAQGGVGRHEAGAGQLQPHHLHHHLV